MTASHLTVCVTAGSVNGRSAVLHGLLAAHGQGRVHPRAALVAARHSFHLRSDVHGEYACACAVLVVSDSIGVDESTRLAGLHARREGVHRFVIFIHQHADTWSWQTSRPLDDADDRRADAVERDARALLVGLGVDGDAAPVVRSPLNEHAMHRLVAALDELPLHLEPAPLAATPPGFVREAALLDAVRPLLAPATLLDSLPATSTAVGGSFTGGGPCREQGEPLPVCPTCRQPMGCLLQVDHRDALHPAPPGLFVVFACKGRHCTLSQVVRHHIAPRMESGPAPQAAGIPWLDEPRLLRPRGRGWQLPDATLLVEEHPSVAARLSAITGGADPVTTFARVAAAMGCPDQFLDHLGGHHDADDTYELHGGPLLTPRCPACAARQTLVVQLCAVGRRWYLWACREHPAHHHCTSQPLGTRL